MFNFIARTAFVLGSTLLPLVAFAAASGTCNSGDDKLMLVDGVIFKSPNDPASAKKIVVALASIKLDAGKIKAAIDPEDEVRKQVWAADLAGQVRLTIRDGALTELYAHVPPGNNINRSGGTALGEIKVTRSDAKGAAGHFTIKGKTNDDLSCDLNFDLDY